MEILKRILKWVFGILILLFGLIVLFLDPITGIVFLFLAVFILPPTLKLFEQKTNLVLSSKAKWITVCIGLAIGIFGLSFAGIDLAEKKGDKTFKTALDFIEKRQIDSAKVYVNKAKEEYASSNNKAAKLEKSTSDDFARETLAKMPDNEFEKLQNNSLEKNYLTNQALNKEFISLLRAHADEREKLVSELKEKKRLKELEEERKRQEELRERREEQAKAQFSAWDGSHPALSRYIKKNMRDPDSYDHISTRFRIEGNSIFVITRFRGANAFGGKAVNTVTATVDFEGNVIEIESWE